MRLSSPIYHLKRRARRLANEADIPFHAALDRIAAQEGYRSWSLLVNKASAPVSASEIYSFLKPGNMVLIGARPGHGKTLPVELGYNDRSHARRQLRRVLFARLHGKRYRRALPGARL